MCFAYIREGDKMQGIIKKEWNQYFKSMTGYIFFAIFLMITGVYFVMGNLMSQNGDIKTFFSSIFSVIMFLIPILTMRSFSEEKKQKTDELLFTSPVRITTVILGKFFATFFVFLAALCFTLLYAVILSVLGASDPAVTVGNYVGIALMAAAFISIGLFISVQTESQLVSAIVTYGVLLLLYLMNSAKAFLDGIAGQLAGFLAVTGHFEEFTYGIFNPVHVVYYVSITVLFLFLSVYSLESRRLR